jgi:alkylation response protein AidB-like acyl-CoA dehydrogenase
MRAHALNVFEELWQTACSGRVPDARAQAEARVTSALVTDTCVDIVNQAFHFAGGSVLQQNNELQRYWRDINAGAQHMAVSNAAYEAYGQLLLGIEPSPQTGPGGIARA